MAGLLQLLFVGVLWHAMRPQLPVTVAHLQLDDVMRVRFITPERAAQPPPPALPAVPPPLPRTPAPSREPVAKGAMTVQLPSPKPVDNTDLYDKHGQPLLPTAAASTPAPGYVQHALHGDTRIMQRDNPIKYQATHFDKDWNGGGNAVDSALQKLVDKTTVKKTVTLPGGIRLHCSLFIFAGGCTGDPPAPPSAKDGDERLSMAPAKPLAGDAHTPPKPSVEACIAMYRAGMPLEWGCPVDTPNRAVDAELREHPTGAVPEH